MTNILAADIGGTNSRFARFEADENGQLSMVRTLWLRTGESGSFRELIGRLKESGFSLMPDQIHMAVIAVAGPVERGVYSSPPFIPWDIDITNARDEYGFKRCILINDFVAQAFACRSPVGNNAEMILKGKVVNDAPAVVLGAGTALGKAALIPDGSGGFVAVPSEGGHANFPFVNERENEFQAFLMQKLGEEYLTANYIVSGRGLSAVHLFLTGEDLRPEEVAGTFSDDSETLDWAARFYGRVCRNYALEILALGGVYIAGGVAAKTPELIKHRAFSVEFYRSRTMSDILKQISVSLISDEESGLWGAALCGLQYLKKVKMQ